MLGDHASRPAETGVYLDWWRGRRRIEEDVIAPVVARPKVEWKRGRCED